ncbi:MAG: hypothetical protein KGI06_01835 [Candidatus Micrarchaeota archaeon]|nr:hypothetical protein [Candidatus Micrarchaeota archaeon]
MPLKTKDSTKDLSRLEQHIGKQVWVNDIDGYAEYKGTLHRVNARKGIVEIKFPNDSRLEVIPLSVLEENHMVTLYEGNVTRKSLKDRAREIAEF